MNKTEKHKYEERAQKLNEEKEAAITAGIDPATIGPGSQKHISRTTAAEAELAIAVANLKKDPDWTFECC